MDLNTWKAKGACINVLRKEVFIIDEGKQHTKNILLLHGYVTSSYCYYKVLDELSKNHRVILIDLIGFGFSEKPKEHYFTILQQADIVQEILKKLNIKTISLLGHDYGGSIINEILVRKNLEQIDFQIESIIFCNVNMRIDILEFSPSQENHFMELTKALKKLMSSKGMFKKEIRELFFDYEKISELELENFWILMQENDGLDIVDYVDNYMEERKTFWNRWHRALRNSSMPIQLIWSKNDRVVLPMITKFIDMETPNSQLSMIDNCGHLPMLEKPKDLLDLILKT
jgi:pimeloyl-ACP methyl ester carboxylesterase